MEVPASTLHRGGYLGSLSFEADGDILTVTVELLKRNYRLFRIEAK